MRRREVLGAVSAGGLGLTSGCLSTVAEAADCSPFARFGVIVENHRFSRHAVRVTVTTPVLDRDVFDETFDVPAATDDEGDSYHPEVAYETDVVSNLRSYDATVRYAGKSSTFSWRVTCEHLHIRVYGDEDPLIRIGTFHLDPARLDR